MKITIAIIATSLAVFACSYTLLSEVDDSDPDANAVAILEPHRTKQETTHAPQAQTAPKMELLTFDEYVARRRSRDAATTNVGVDPRWEFSPRQALESLGKVRLVYAVAPTDTGARNSHYADREPPRHYGLTVWEVKTKSSHAGLRVACTRLVSSAKDTAPTAPPARWSVELGRRIYSEYSTILSTHDVSICGNIVRVTHYLPHGQCNEPFREHWNAAFVTGGWAVYLNSAFHQGSDPKAAALDVVRAADLITDAIRTAKVGVDRPKVETCQFEGIWWGNQKATFAFSLESPRGKEICANLWNRVPREYSATGIKGYGTQIIKVSGKGQIQGEVTAGTYMGIEAFQLDWADEFGVGGSILHELKPLPALIEDLKHEDIQVRIDAVFALGRSGLPGVPALMEAMNDKEGRVRRVAAIALGSIGPAAKDAVPALIGGLDDNDKNVRYPAVVALRKIGPAAKDAVPILEVMCERDPDSNVRREAATALKRIGNQTTDRRE
jgi:hypothetical protein